MHSFYPKLSTQSSPLCLNVCGFGSVSQSACFPSNIPGTDSAFPLLRSVPLPAQLEQHSGIYYSSRQTSRGKESRDKWWLATSVNTFCKVSEQSAVIKSLSFLLRFDFTHSSCQMTQWCKVQQYLVIYVSVNPWKYPCFKFSLFFGSCESRLCRHPAIRRRLRDFTSWSSSVFSLFSLFRLFREAESWKHIIQAELSSCHTTVLSTLLHITKYNSDPFI